MIEQIIYLLFIRRLDELQTLAENRAITTGTAIANQVFGGGMSEPAGRIPRPLHDLRRSRFKNLEAKAMFKVVNDHVFPFLRARCEQGRVAAITLDTVLVRPHRRAGERFAAGETWLSLGRNAEGSNDYAVAAELGALPSSTDADDTD